MGDLALHDHCDAGGRQDHGGTQEYGHTAAGQEGARGPGGAAMSSGTETNKNKSPDLGLKIVMCCK